MLKKCPFNQWEFFMRFSTILCASVAALALGACSVTSTNQAVAPQESTGVFGIKSADYAVETEKAFKGVNRVVIGSFKVGFLEEKRESRKAGGGLFGGGFGGKSSAHVTLSGLTPELMQAITDAAYADFLKQLQAQGYTVEDRAQLLASADFAKANKQPSPLRQESSFFGSDNTLTYVAPKEIENLYFFMAETPETGGFGFSNPSVAAMGFADKNKLPVLSVTYLLDFVGSTGHGGAFTSTSSLEIGQSMHVPSGYGITLIGGQAGSFSTNNGSVKLGQPVHTTATFGEIEQETGEGMVAAETALNVVSALAGAGTNQHRQFAIKANPDQYQNAATGVLKDANKRLIDKMKSLQ
jgi:hypothetical protein